MNLIVRRSFLFAAALMCVTALGVGARAVSSSSMFKPPVPPVIAVVDLQAIVKAIDERTVKDADFQNKGKELQANLQKMNDELEQLNGTLEGTPDGAPRANLAKRIFRQANQLKFERQLAEKELDELYGDMLRDLYAKITTACDKLAKQNGYTMVLASDEGIDIPRGGKDDVSRAISMRRMLFVDDAHDITADVVLMMNNDFRAAGGKAVPPPADK